MKTLTDQLEQLAELQKKNLEPVRRLNDVAFTAFELIARKNYELMGDMVDYAVAQSRGQLEPGSPQQRLERQMSEAKAFAERIGRRASEYAELAGSLRERAVGGAADTTVDPREGLSPEEAADRTLDTLQEGGRTAKSKKAAAKKASVEAATAPARAAVRTANAAAATTGRAATKVARAGDVAARKVASKKSAAKKKPTAKKRAAKKSAGKRAAKA